MNLPHELKIAELEKQLTLKVRDLEIETALEKVRSSALAMKQPADMIKVCRIISRQLKIFGVKNIRNTQTVILNESKSTYLNYQYFPPYNKSIIEDTEYAKHPKANELAETVKKSANAFFSQSFRGKSLDKFRKYRKDDKQFPDPLLDKSSSVHFYFYSIGPGALGISTYNTPLSKEDLNLLRRFRNVFELAYRRFIDIEQAIAQAREAQIELGLERVRARAMAMQKSHELVEVIDILQKELTKLEFILNNCIFWIMDEEPPSATWWIGPVNKTNLPESYLVPFPNQPYFNSVFEAWKKRIAKWVYELKGTDKKEADQYIFTETDLARFPDKVKKAFREVDKVYISFSFYNYGGLHISTKEPLTEEQLEIVKRFSKVFDMTYTRFLDLQKAEAQAREAQIEAALERVRSRTMGMQKSEELKVVIKVVYDQFVHLKILVEHAGFIIDYKARDDMHIWLADQHEVPFQVTIPYFDCAHWNSFNEAKEKGTDFFANQLSFEEKNKFYQDLFKLIPGVSDKAKKYYFNCPGLAISTVLLENVGLYIENFSGIPYSDEENKTLMRFGNVFQQTYTRFLDLQKAEAQARESQIEAALERVRAGAMAMHTSDDLTETMSVVFRELPKLGIGSLRCGVVLLSKNSTRGVFYAAATTSESDSFTMIGSGEMTAHPVFEKQHEYWMKNENYFLTLSNDELKSYYDSLISRLQVPYTPREHSGQKEHGYYFPFSEGMFYAWSEEPYLENQINVLNRFKAIIDLTFRRYFDLQKAEAQSRESQIEASLERVRSKAMAMQKSDDLSIAVATIFEELDKLDLGTLRCGIGIINKEKKSADVWSTTKSEGGKIVQVSGDEPIVHPLLEGAYDAWLKQGDFSYLLKGKDLNEYYKGLTRTNFKLPDSESKISEEEGLRQFYYVTAFPTGNLYAFRETEFPEEAKLVMKRFAEVINITYTRFLDLQKAEAQTREAQIELALERVRARTMAMQKSEELSEASFVLFTQLKELGELAEQISIGIYNENEMVMELYATIYGNQWNETGKIPYNKNIVQRKIYSAWKEQKKSIIIDLSGEELKDFNKFKMEYSSQYKSENELPQNRWVIHIAFFSKGVLFFSTTEPHPHETIQLLERFAGVFDLTYTRFLDLKNAEAQAREVQIELALERVRARTMAMQKSEELSEAAYVLFQQFQELGQEPEQFTIGIIKEAEHIIEFWHTWLGSPMEAKVIMTIDEPHVANRAYTLWKSQNKSAIIDLSGKELKEYNVYRKKRLQEANVDLGTVLDEEQRRIIYLAFFSKGTISISTHEPRPAETIQLLERFAGVFDLTYTRFLDLKNAEAQAREAKIEVSLERVRSKSMSMHNPDDLSSTVSQFFKELKSLNVLPWRCGVGQIDEETKTNNLTTTSITNSGESIEVMGKLKQEGHPVLDSIFEHWKMQKEYYPVLQGDEINKYYAIIKPQIAFPDYPLDAEQYGHFIFFKEGFVFAWTENKLSEEELQIFRRFASVLSLTYRRYMDLKEAEARAVEAVRQASLDRVRAEIASMRTAEDLNRITPIIWRELKTLDVPFIRCGVYIVDETNSKVQVYLTTPDGKSLAVLNLDFNANELTSNSVEYWRKKNIYTEHWTKKQFISWTKSMIEQGQIQNAETYQGSIDPPESLDLYFVPFTQGMLYVGNTSPLIEEKLQTVASLAEAFSIAYARYEDFKNIEEAKNRTEITLSELKSAQTQLIHSEKMASLGELTAGIAHEIKNPLNFVNNFSEVSRELLDEMKTGLQNKNNEEVLDIIEDLKQNLEKINQHGKRADSIVKGMLLHSRGTSGEKVLTNINDLLDQYVTLAYHGLRAQNKEFNITIEKNYDKSIDKVTVVPQDISRVFLNLINNACYAAYEKKKMRENNFSPTLNVSTKNLQNKVEIRIRDNGYGIPESIREQIFNPFFTTKPTGEGTGLGLSISYDIVTKVHGGEIKFESEEGKYTEFIISLPAP